MTDIFIISITGKHLQKYLDAGLNVIPGRTGPEMTNPAKPADENEGQKWYPIDSTVTDTEIREVEEQLNCILPSSYKAFLKHKHFYELYIDEARFSGQEIRNWKKHLAEMAFEGYPREMLFDKGYIPFADWSDWGLLCFDTNKQAFHNEYPVVRWDHERGDVFEPFSENFHALLMKLDKLSEINRC